MAKSSSGAEAGAFQRPEYTRSLLPEPSSFFNSEIIIIEPDGSRAVWYSDGTQWLPGGGTGASNFDQLTGDPLDNPALFGYLDGETGYCSGNDAFQRRFSRPKRVLDLPGEQHRAGVERPKL